MPAALFFRRMIAPFLVFLSLFIRPDLVAEQLTAPAGADNPSQFRTLDELLSDCIEAQKQTDHVHLRLKAKTTHPDGTTSRNDFRIIRDRDRLDILGQQEYPAFSFSEKLRIVINDEEYLENSGGYRDVIWSQSNRRRFLTRYLTAYDYGFVLDGFLCGAENRLTELALRDSSRRILRTEEIDGIECTVVQSDTAFGELTLWISAESGHPVLRMECIKGPNHIFTDKPDDQTPLSAQPAPDGTPRIRWTALLDRVKTALIGEIHIPVSGRLTETDQRSDGSNLSIIVDFEREILEVDSHADAADAFLFSGTAGAPVADRDHPDSGVLLQWDGTKVVPVTGVVPTTPSEHARGSRRMLWLFAANAIVLLLIVLGVLIRKHRCSS